MKATHFSSTRLHGVPAVFRRHQFPKCHHSQVSVHSAATAVGFTAEEVLFLLLSIESLLFGFHVLFCLHQSEQQRNRSVKGARKKLFDLRNSESSHDGRPTPMLAVELT